MMAQQKHINVQFGPSST